MNESLMERVDADLEGTGCTVTKKDCNTTYVIRGSIDNLNAFINNWNS